MKNIKWTDVYGPFSQKNSFQFINIKHIPHWIVGVEREVTLVVVCNLIGGEIST